MLPTTRPPLRRPRPSKAVYRRRRFVAFGIPVVLALFIYLAVSTGGGSPAAPPHSTSRHQPPTQHHTTTAPTIAVGLRTFAVVDPSRTTYSYVSGKSTPGRHLGIEVRYPTRDGSAAAETTNARPHFSASATLVVFAGGFRLQPSNYKALLDAWVRAGFLVAAIDFPDTTYPASESAYTAGQPHGSPESDQYNEPADVAFVVHQLLDDDTTSASWLYHSFNAKDVALAGHSDGGSVVSALTYDPTYSVSGLPIGAVLDLSGGEFAISNQHYGTAGSGVPLLVVQSAADTCAVPYEAVSLYDAITGPKYLLELDAASHLGAYDGSDPAAPLVRDVTTAFLRAAFSHGGVTNDSALMALGTKSGVASITDNSLAAPIATPAGSSGGQCPHD